MSTLRSPYPLAPPPRTPELFIAQAKTAHRHDGLDPRVIKQVNFKLPETEHADLMAMVKTLPDMSMQKFIYQALTEKIERTKRGES